MHIHQWEVVRTVRYRDTFNLPHTEVYKSCNKCPKVKTNHINGHWSTEELWYPKKVAKRRYMGEPGTYCGKGICALGDGHEGKCDY